MRKTYVAIGAFSLLGLAAVGVGKGIVPQTIVPILPGKSSARPNESLRGGLSAARARRAVAEAFRYKGTTAVPGRDLEDDDSVLAACRLLSRADFVSEQRLRHFAGLDPSCTIVGWHLTVDGIDVRAQDTLLRVRAVPLLRAPGEGKLGLSAYYRENYRLVGGELHFISGDPVESSESIGMGGAS